MDRYQITLVSLWIHVPFVITWIGLVMLDGFALFGPGLTDVQRKNILLWSRPFVVVAIPVIMVTGVWQTIDNPFIPIHSYANLDRLLHQTTYGRMLFFKHGCIVVTFALTVLVRFVLAPRAQAVVATSAVDISMASDLTERWLRTATALNLASCLAALLLATRMVNELH